MGLLDFLLGGSKKEELITTPKIKGTQDTLSRLQHYTDPIEQLVVESVENLKEHNPSFDTTALEAEAIYLAAFVYLKNDYRIDFEVNYLTAGLLDRIPSEDYSIADKVFKYMEKHYPNKYGDEEINHGINGYKMNIQLAPNYGSHIKNYFIRAHKIGESANYTLFSSPKNCLWRDGIKNVDSPTQRDVYYKFEGSAFELMIPPFNPLICGRIVSKTVNEIKCQSSDDKRTFIFHYIGEISPANLDVIEMYRNDKGDLVTYHKE